MRIFWRLLLELIFLLACTAIGAFLVVYLAENLVTFFKWGGAPYLLGAGGMFVGVRWWQSIKKDMEG